MNYIYAVLIVSILFGCKKESLTSSEKGVNIGIQQFNLNDTIRMNVGQIASLSNKELTFRFDSVISDSRCPKGMECFIGGIASMLLTFPDYIDTLNGGQIVHGMYTIHYINLLPYPVVNQFIDKNTYVLYLKVTK